MYAPISVTFPRAPLQHGAQYDQQLGGIFDTIWSGIKTAGSTVFGAGKSIVTAGVSEIFGSGPSTQVPTYTPDGRLVQQTAAVGQPGGTYNPRPIIIQSAPAQAGLGMGNLLLPAALVGGALLLSRRR